MNILYTYAYYEYDVHFRHTINFFNVLSSVTTDVSSVSQGH